MGFSSVNFSFLECYDPQLVRLAALAEHHFTDDPNASLLKLRLYAELMAQLVAIKGGIYQNADETQSDLLRRLRWAKLLPEEINQYFHQLRQLGNRAAHDGFGNHAEALNALKIACVIGVWFHRAFGSQPKFSPGPFVPPQSPAKAATALQEEIARLQQVLNETRTEAEKTRLSAEAQAQALLSAEVLAQKEASDRVLWEQMAQEAEQAKIALTARLEQLQVTVAAAPPVEALPALIEAAASELDLDEAATRSIIDSQLRDLGWEVDSKEIRYASGVRPVRGRNMAIAEWPTASGPADYALFIGTVCVGVVEAKRQRKNVSAAIDQTERYSKGFHFKDGADPAAGPWDEFKIPFLFSTNGRPYLKQVETESGIWFRDARKPTNLRRALTGWHTPEGLKAMLDMDEEKAAAALKAQPFDFGFPLRPYQQRAIERVEEELGHGKRQMLVAMATGTGKTKLAIAMLSRLLEAKRFRRVCFVVDRSALGDQTANEFSTTRMVSTNSFSDIFGVKGLKDVSPDAATKVHICTIQGLVKRVLYAMQPGDVPPIDQYDLIVVDECHRGYLLDREMSDAELSFRGQDDYVSKYRHVLEHFDAVKIGLTATPALHTREIFGDPIFTYSYREAVIDNFLCDYEPPYNLTTELSARGITFGRGDNLPLFNSRTGSVDITTAPDEMHFDVEEFNRKVITVPFNAAISEILAEHIDPNAEGKTLIFAVTDAHADIVVEQVKKAMAAKWGAIEDSAVKKITGSVDGVRQLIRKYRNDNAPKIAVTVDLLTTGIDVPSIVNLVFLRRVNSRILFDQMIGRATRKCDEIGKETFRIFDAVDIFAHLQEMTDMRPVVVNPSISFEQLLDELAKVNDNAHRAILRDQILVKLARCLKKMPEDIHSKYEATSGEKPEDTYRRFKGGDLPDLSAWAKSHGAKIAPLLDWSSGDTGGPTILPISYHEDKAGSVTRGYGSGQKPEDFLDAFTKFVKDNLNTIAALTAVVKRPRDLTRAQLRELALLLAQNYFTEASLQSAWRDAKNVDIAASIIGFIRQAALGDPLIPYEQRVQAAMQRIVASRSWTDPQRQWLRRIGEQFAQEVIVDREAIDRGQFAANGGFNYINRAFNGQLETILGDISEELWRRSA